MARVIMIQGTMSNAGKSLIAAGLCRVFHQDGYRVAPFKSQNMALNSFVTSEGLEMGRAQVMQAEAAGIEPCSEMNPILLKPTSDVGSQVIVNGKPVGNMDAGEYYRRKTELIPDIKRAFKALEERADIIVIEGAGSPAEINLRDNDIVNMGLAQMVDAPVLLVGDIDRGGVFAQLVGTLELLEPEERARVKGLVINKFRGDESLLYSGVDILTERTGIPTVGILPYIDIRLDDEDSLSDRLNNKKTGSVDIAVIRLPHISNFTDFDVFDTIPEAGVRYVSRPHELAGADLVILPGSKNTISDLLWLRRSGLADAIKRYAANGGGALVGICGGYQMLGELVSDPDKAEEGGCAEGIGLLPVRTVLGVEKITKQSKGTLSVQEGILSSLSGEKVSGYEIHMGRTESVKNCGEFAVLDGNVQDGACLGNVYGTYLHGVFDEGDLALKIVKILAGRKGVPAAADTPDYRSFRESEYDRLADMLRRHMDMDAVCGCLQEAQI